MAKISKQNKKFPGKSDKGSPMWWIGLWATVWWGVTCVYVLLLVWMAAEYYAYFVENDVASGSTAWFKALGEAYMGYPSLQLLLYIIALVWVISAWFWLRQLKIEKISYSSALKDLFLTIRK